MAICPQINDKIKGTDTVNYNSVPLPCSNVITGDNLNIVFDKYNTTICNIITSVNVLTENLINISENVIEDSLTVIELLNKTNICCPTCTFTGTATQTL